MRLDRVLNEVEKKERFRQPKANEQNAINEPSRYQRVAYDVNELHRQSDIGFRDNLFIPSNSTPGRIEASVMNQTATETSNSRQLVGSSSYDSYNISASNSLRLMMDSTERSEEAHNEMSYESLNSNASPYQVYRRGEIDTNHVSRYNLIPTRVAEGNIHQPKNYQG